MSVYYQTFVVYGWEIGYDTYRDYDDEEWSNELTEEYGWRDRDVGDVAVISDGMAGKYAYFGLVVAASNSTRSGEQNIGQVALEEPETDELRRVEEAVASVGLDVGQAKYHVFTHVT